MKLFKKLSFYNENTPIFYSNSSNIPSTKNMQKLVGQINNKPFLLKKKPVLGEMQERMDNNGNKTYFFEIRLEDI